MCNFSNLVVTVCCHCAWHAIFHTELMLVCNCPMLQGVWFGNCYSVCVQFGRAIVGLVWEDRGELLESVDFLHM